MPMIETSTTRIYAADHAGADAPFPLLLIHGAGGSHLDWPAQMRRLGTARIVAPDLPGHGKSPLPGHDSVAAYAAALVTLLDALHLDRAVMIGHSMGGAIALTLALDYADRVAGLVLLGAGAKLSVHPDILERIRPDPAAVAQSLSDWLWGENATPDQRALTVSGVMAQSVDVIYGDYVACNGFDVRARLGEIATPTLIFAGTQDRMTPHKFGLFLQQNIPGAQLVTLEGAGHMMALEQPDFIAGAVEDWLHSAVFRPGSE